MSGTENRRFRSTSTTESHLSLLSDRPDSRPASPTLTISPRLRGRESFSKLRSSDSLKNILLSDVSDRSESCFKLLRSTSYCPPKRSFVPKENSRGIAVSEVLLYLPQSELLNSGNASYDSDIRDDRNDNIDLRAKKYDMRNDANNYSNDINMNNVNSKSAISHKNCTNNNDQIKVEITNDDTDKFNGMASYNINNASNRYKCNNRIKNENAELAQLDKIMHARKVRGDSNNDNLLTRAALALSRYVRARLCSCVLILSCFYLSICPPDWFALCLSIYMCVLLFIWMCLCLSACVRAIACVCVYR